MAMFERALVFQVGGDAGRAEGVIADAGLDAGVSRAALNHAVGVLLPHGVARKFAGLAGRRFVAPGQKRDNLWTAPHFTQRILPPWFRWPVRPAAPWRP